MRIQHTTGHFTKYSEVNSLAFGAVARDVGSTPIATCGAEGIGFAFNHIRRVLAGGELICWNG